MFGLCSFAGASFASTGFTSELNVWNEIDTSQTPNWVQIVT